MLTNEELQTIQEIIGYEFADDRLLRQAFTRKSYAQEHGSKNHNEVLEFYGDKALEFIVMQHLSEYYGEFTDNGKYASALTEGQLTEVKKKLIGRKMLASRIAALGLGKYLLMGKGDQQKNVQDEASVKEDLFEAIIGAVAIDCGWDADLIGDVVERMLPVEEYLENGFKNECNYVDLIQQWCQKRYGILPEYDFSEDDEGFCCDLSLGEEFVTATAQQDDRRVNAGISVDMWIRVYGHRYTFAGKGYNKAAARMDAAKEAYQYLEEFGSPVNMFDEVGQPDFDRAINQLQELYQKGYIQEPRYRIQQKPFYSGEPVWECYCGLGDTWALHRAESTSKKLAKKEVAYQVLCRLMEQQEN